ncbi:MAG: permease-like cell division protein FtsX [Thermincola sp.]|jgi:cell division transport system permease protein|nr:permease-like cell division protein FtsX [Thermincola sp.]MDT3702992.1 permease-like cell division protein FtsX [Thermincola sp.]
MKNIAANLDYFCRETITLLRQSLISNIISILSICLILFILAMVIGGWRVSNHVADIIQGEAEINVFYNEGLDTQGVSRLTGKLQGLVGVREARAVDKSEAYDRMAEILGDEAEVLKLFNENPFSPMIAVKINLDKIDQVLQELDHIPGIEHVQNNRAVLERLRDISGMMRLLGLLVMTAVGISTLIIISQLIRLGIQNSSEQIRTLRLLGAPESFIALPFLLQGLLLTVAGGVLAVSMAAIVMNQAYAQMTEYLSFIPLLPAWTLMSSIIVMVMSLSIILGIAGSLIGLTFTTPAHRQI